MKTPFRACLSATRHLCKASARSASGATMAVWILPRLLAQGMGCLPRSLSSSDRPLTGQLCTGLGPAGAGAWNHSGPQCVHLLPRRHLPQRSLHHRPGVRPLSPQTLHVRDPHRAPTGALAILSMVPQLTRHCWQIWLTSSMQCAFTQDSLMSRQLRLGEMAVLHYSLRTWKLVTHLAAAESCCWV